jgi:hypothetical protein
VREVVDVGHARGLRVAANAWVAIPVPSARSSGTNLLDKVASFLHLYYRTARRSHTVYFRTLAHPASRQELDA